MQPALIVVAQTPYQRRLAENVVIHAALRRMLCGFHARWAGQDGVPDAFYHRKVVLGLTVPADGFLTAVELQATLHGRSRGDGRRLDAYCLDDAIDPALEV